ncbi:MAG: helix-turn-helix transcriptional regulator [Bacteroides sp.]
MNRLQERRLELGLTQPQVSELLKAADPRMDVGMVSRFERGACLPTPSVLEVLESALQAPRIVLYGEDELCVLENTISSGEPMEPPDDVLRLVFAVGRTRANATTRHTLCLRLGLSDRKVRELIECARRYGYFIINEQDGRGYFISDDLDDIERQYKQDTNRVLSVLARRRSLRDKLKEAGRDV